MEKNEEEEEEEEHSAAVRDELRELTASRSLPDVDAGLATRAKAGRRFDNLLQELHAYRCHQLEEVCQDAHVHTRNLSLDLGAYSRPRFAWSHRQRSRPSPYIACRRTARVWRMA